MAASNSAAADNRSRMGRANLLSINMMSSPGSGKTTLLEKTLAILEPDKPCAVLVGDLQTTRDAERLSISSAQITQINTGGGCHLSPAQVARGLDTLDLDNLNYLFIENVGNMVCPAAFDLGEHKKVILLSVPEGDDKVAKYPTLFQKADVILLTKTDLLSVLDFEVSRVRDDLSRVNTAAPLIELSCKSGQGMDIWMGWLDEAGKRIKNNLAGLAAE